MGGRRRAEKNSKNLARIDWCTPEPVLECVRECGPIELDPCSNASSIVGAERSFTLPERNGLRDPWTTKSGSVYVNHPFSAEMVECWDGEKRRTNEAWARRAAHQAPHCPGGIFVLTPANPCSRWWTWYWNYASLICFWDGRLQFLGAEHTADFEVALVWFGPDALVEEVASVLASRGRTVPAWHTQYSGKRERVQP